MIARREVLRIATEKSGTGAVGIRVIPGLFKLPDKREKLQD